MKNLTIIIACLLILASACNHERGTYSPIPPEIKDKINWQPGSYWIMEDSATHRVDSFYVTSYETSIHYGSQDNSNEQIDIGIHQQSLSQPNADTCFWSLNVGGYQINNLVIHRSEGNCHLGGSNYVIYPNEDAYNNYHSSYTLNGITYQDVYVNGIYPVPDTGIYFNVALQDANGPVYLGFRLCGYSYNWFLKRKNIVRN